MVELFLYVCLCPNGPRCCIQTGPIVSLQEALSIVSIRDTLALRNRKRTFMKTFRFDQSILRELMD